MTGGPDGTWRILVVDDDDVFRHRLARALQERGHSIASAASRGDARIAGMLGIDAALVDLRLGMESGLDVAADLLSINSAVHVVIMTGLVAQGLEAAILRLGLKGFVSKPFDLDQALDLLK